MATNRFSDLKSNCQSPYTVSEITFSTVQSYLAIKEETPVPMAGSNSCILLIRPGQSIDLQLRFADALSVDHSDLPHLAKFEYLKGSTASYDYLSISCRVSDFNESVLKFFNTISTFYVIEKMAPCKALISAHTRWKRLLECEKRIDQKMLQGLWGEFWVLNAALSNEMIDSMNLLHNWTGPMGAPNDFTFGNACVEVKTTTHTDNIVQISSLHQLDVCNAWIILIKIFHVAKEDGGKSVNDLFKEIRKHLLPMEDEVFLKHVEYLCPTDILNEYDNYTFKESSYPNIIAIDDKTPILTESRLKQIYSIAQVSRLVDIKYSLDLSENINSEILSIPALFKRLSSGGTCES